MSDYKKFANKIRKAKDLETLNKLENSLTNLYNNGIFTVSEFSRLDILLIDNKIKLEN